MGSCLLASGRALHNRTARFGDLFSIRGVRRRPLLLLYESFFGMETAQLVTRLLVGYEVSGGRRSRQVIRDSRRNRYGTSASRPSNAAEETAYARTAPVDTPMTREELRKRKLATSGSGLRAAVHRRACMRRTTEVPQRLRTHTETSQSTPRFQTRGPRRCRRII